MNTTAFCGLNNMTRQQELELLAEWLGIDYKIDIHGKLWRIENKDTPHAKWFEFAPSPEGNDTDFLNMVAGRVHILWGNYNVRVWLKTDDQSPVIEASYTDHNNDKLAAMKHAAYQVCLTAAREGKEGKENGAS